MTVAASPKVSICSVSYNSATDLPEFFKSLGRLTYSPLELCLIDCASTDNSTEVAERLAPRSLPCKVIGLPQNIGFAGGMNRAVAESDGALVLSLNPDTRPTPDFVDHLVARATTEGWRIGAVTGRLIRLDSDSQAPTIDACGMRLTPTWRHLDRGSGALDRGQWRTAERVFGGTGAATLFSREALEDVALDDQVFDPDFHSYREDAELCFRLRERRWEIVFEPRAICGHRRLNLPGRRREMSSEINFHSLKNRYLLRAYHQDLPNFALTLLPSLFRDLMAFGYVLTREHDSFAAYSWLWSRRRQIIARRRRLFERRSCSWLELNRWFVRRRLAL